MVMLVFNSCWDILIKIRHSFVESSVGLFHLSRRVVYLPIVWQNGTEITVYVLCLLMLPVSLRRQKAAKHVFLKPPINYTKLIWVE